MHIKSASEVNLVVMTVWAAAREMLGPITLEKFTAVVTNPAPAELASFFPEYIFANRNYFSAEAKARAADVCDYATGLGFYALGVDQRGEKISAILRGGSDANAPAPLPQFVPPATIPTN